MSVKATFMVPHPPLIVKEVGKGNEKQVQKTIDAYEEVAKEIKELNPDTIIISSPHAPMYADYFYISKEEKLKGSFDEFGAKDISFEEDNDLELVNLIEEECKKINYPAGTVPNKNSLDHATMVPLYFIRKYLSDFKIVVIGLSGLSLIEHYKLGKLIQKALTKYKKNIVYVASGDLSHKLQSYGPYGFIEEGPIYDERIMDVMSNARFNELLEFDRTLLDKAAECGHRSFTIMAGVLDGYNVESKQLSHEDITGVGYGICYFIPKDISPDRLFLDDYLLKEKEKNNSKDEYVQLAKNTIDLYIKENKKLEIPKKISKELLNDKRGVFVSIHKFGALRGCIGTIVPTTNSIAEEIINNAIEAATNDPRFDSITINELPYLEINVDVLGPIEKISSREELDPKKYGVIVTSGIKRGLLLPNLDGIDTVDEQISIAKQKAGIYDNEIITLERFEVVRHI